MVLVTACLLLLSPQSGQAIDVWKPDLTIKDVASILSSGPDKFDAEQQVATRRLHIFVRGQKPLDIAQMTCQTLGLKLAKRGDSWRFERDRAYERMLQNHEQEVQSEIQTALNRLLTHLANNPPRLTEPRHPTDSKWTAALPPLNSLSESFQDTAFRMSLESPRDDVLWMLARLNAKERQELAAGHAVIGALPAIPGCVSLPGVPDDYSYLKGAEQAFLILELDRLGGTIHATPVRLPLGQYFPNANKSEFPIRGHSIETEVVRWQQSWQQPRDGRIEYLLGNQRWQPNGQTHGDAAEFIASAIKRPTIIEATPKTSGPFMDPWQASGAIREEGKWLLVKPPKFWELESAWELPAKLAKFGPAPVPDAQKTLDWMSQRAVSIQKEHWQTLSNDDQVRIAGLGVREVFARFWLALTPQEKARALDQGLTRASLSPPKQTLFTDAACYYLSHMAVWGDVSGLLSDGPKAILVIKPTPFWGHLDGTRLSQYPDKDSMLSVEAHRPTGIRQQGLTFEISFQSGSGLTRNNHKAYAPL